MQRLRAGSVEVEGVGAGRSGSGCHIACPLSPLSVVLPCHPSTERRSVIHQLTLLSPWITFKQESGCDFVAVYIVFVLQDRFRR